MTAPAVRSVRSGVLAGALLVSLLPVSLSAQIGGRLRRAAGDAARNVPNPAELLRGDPPITTSLGDARWAVDSLDAHNPDSSVFTPIAQLPRSPSGGWVLRAGHFAYQGQSYCLKAGTHGPGGGDGYIYAPTAGPASEHVLAILRNSVQHPEIPQRNIQLLLWAIIARASFDELSNDLKTTAARLLTPAQLATLNRNALELAGPLLERAIEGMPPLVQQVFRAEAELRRMLAGTDARFEDMERVAVLAGLAPRGEGSRDIPLGRWSLHPEGYYIRFLPSGYSSTRVEIWVPEGSRAVGREFDPATHIAVPGNTSRQRLVQSGRLRA